MDILRIGLTHLVNVLDFKGVDDYTDGDIEDWPFERIAKKAALLFDQLAISTDLDITIEMAESITNYSGHQIPNTLRFLRGEGLLFDPTIHGFQSGKAFVDTYLKGTAKKIQADLLEIGDANLDPDLIGQPDFTNYLGWPPPRWEQEEKLGLRSGEMISRYQSLVVRRDAALLRSAGFFPVIIGPLFENPKAIKDKAFPIWKVVLNEIPQLDDGVPWHDILDFRAEEDTQQMVRRLRNWVRKSVSEDMNASELQDEIRQLVYEYEEHMRIAQMSATKGPLEFLITGAAQLAEDVIKLRFGKIAQIASVYRNYKVELLKAETKARGRELALIPKIREWLP